MKTVGWLVSLVLPFFLCCRVAAQNASSPRRGNHPQTTVSRPSGAQSGGHTTRGFVPEAPRKDTNPNHPRYHYGGGFAYYPYYGTYNTYVPNAVSTDPIFSGQTATDRLIANGGTFYQPNGAPAVESENTDPPNREPARLPSSVEYSSTGVGTALPTTFAGDASRIPEMNSPAVDENPAILVFADGHKMQVQNYAVFAGSVIVLGGERRRIPLNLLDLKATLAANDQAGYTFRIPAVYLK